MNYVKKYLHNPTNRWHETFAGVYLCGFAIFCVLRELIFSIWTEWFFLLGIIFAIFRKYPVLSVDNIFCIFVLSENMQQKYIFSNKNKTNISLPFFYTVLFLNERDKLLLNRNDFLELFCLCSELKSENIYPGINFCGKNVCGNFYLRELTFADDWKNRKN